MTAKGCEEGLLSISKYIIAPHPLNRFLGNSCQDNSLKKVSFRLCDVLLSLYSSMVMINIHYCLSNRVD